MAAITIFSDLGAPKNKVCHFFQCFPIYLPWSDGTTCYDLSFLNVELFTFIKRLFSSSSLSAIRVVSSAYLRLLIFLPAIVYIIYTDGLCPSIIYLMLLNTILNLYASHSRTFQKIIVPGLELVEEGMTGLGFTYSLSLWKSLSICNCMSIKFFKKSDEYASISL